MESPVGSNVRSEQYAHQTSVPRIAGLGTVLVAVNIALMWVLSYTPAAGVGRLLYFSNFFLGIATFAVTIGGGFWLSNWAIEENNLPIAGIGVGAIQIGYALLGAAILSIVSSAIRAPVLGITTVITALITAGVVVVVYRTDRSFANWQRYAGGFFIGGLVVGAAGFFLSSMLMMIAPVLFFLGFIVDLTYEIWAVKENRYASTLRNAIGIYIAVMGVFVHILMWVVRVLSMLDN